MVLLNTCIVYPKQQCFNLENLKKLQSFFNFNILGLKMKKAREKEKKKGLNFETKGTYTIWAYEELQTAPFHSKIIYKRLNQYFIVNMMWLRKNQG